MEQSRKLRNQKAGPLSTAAHTGRCIADSSALSVEYTHEELEFMKAMDRYKREQRRPFPTWHEVLAVLKSLGYTRAARNTQGNGDS
jgi:hypothetical protein